MENNNKKWNKESIWSGIILIVIVVILTNNIFLDLNLPFKFISDLDFYAYWHFGLLRASNIFFYIPEVVLAILFFLSIYFGIKSINKTVGVGVISTM